MNANATPVGMGGPNERGRWVVLVGPDGVGKTTVARAIVEQYGGPSAYFHFLPPVRGSLARAPEPALRPPPPKTSRSGSRVLGWIRLLRNAIRCWLGYLGTVRPALRRSWLVIGDRWMYGYLAQPTALKFYGPALIARVVVRLLPKPHLIVNLAAPTQVIRLRKQELTSSQLEQELLAWSALELPNVCTIDATRSPQLVAKEILACI